MPRARQAAAPAARAAQPGTLVVAEPLRQRLQQRPAGRIVGLRGGNGRDRDRLLRRVASGRDRQHDPDDDDGQQQCCDQQCPWRPVRTGQLLTFRLRVHRVVVFGAVPSPAYTPRVRRRSRRTKLTAGRPVFIGDQRAGRKRREQRRAWAHPQTARRVRHDRPAVGRPPATAHNRARTR
ncbi:hypothetical protein I552_4820 [Mycobacterium xenopi 3993]|nr:hypothetical protein I552_4820 [Mycobacterium xenopi 3993]